MIDWIDFTAPLEHDTGEGSPFNAGRVTSTNAYGVIDWAIGKRMDIEGSHDSKISVRSARTRKGLQGIRISGNIVKWFQGHNIFGTNDISGLVYAALDRVMAHAGITPSDQERAAWLAGNIDLDRVDVTESADFSTLPRVLNALRSLDATAHLKFRGRGLYNGNSLLFGKGSRRSSLLFYAKGPEIAKHKLPFDLRDTPLTAHAQGLLRMEFRFHTMHLKPLGLDTLLGWNENTALEVHRMHLGHLNISDSIMLDPADLEGFSPRIRAAYQLWVDGHDLRAMFPRPTFYRYRAALLAAGIDIAIKQDREKSNVIPLRTVLVGKPVQVPDWAMNTPLYFEPRKTATT